MRLAEPNLDALLTSTFHVYRRGLRRQSQPRLPMPVQDFDRLKFLGTIGWMPPPERLRLRSLHTFCGKGLQAARQGDPAGALIHYQQAKEDLDLLEKSGRLAWLLGISTYETGLAYLDFRCGFQEQAGERLERAMDADLELEAAGLNVMQIHRIQQGHNLARMALRLNRRDEAMRLAGLLVGYIEWQIGELPFHQGWRPQSLRAVPRSLLRAMIEQILGEMTGFIVTGGRAAREWGDLVEASPLCRNPEDAIFPQAQFALKAQYSRLMCNRVDYLLNLQRFFEFGIRDCYLLWYALMTELVGFCLEVDTRRSREVREMILKDSIKWKGVPPFLRDCFASLHPAQPTIVNSVASASDIRPLS